MGCFSFILDRGNRKSDHINYYTSVVIDSATMTVSLSVVVTNQCSVIFDHLE